MSRCFPFPPPGYEKKARSADLDLLLKEKQKERKHKERKDKDKSENKEKRAKDGKTEKHRDKDHKEKHKEKKREKNRRKDKHKTTDGYRNVEKIDNNAPCHLAESSRAAEEKKFKDEFTRRITGDGNNAEHQKVVDFTNIGPRQFGGALTDRGNINESRENKGSGGVKKSSDAPERFVMRDHATGDNRFSDDFNRRIRSDGKTTKKQLVENFNSMDPRGSDCVFTDRTMGNQVRNKNKDRLFEDLLGSKDMLICKSAEDHTKDNGSEKLTEEINRTKEALMGKNKRKERRLQDVDKTKETVEVKEETKEGEEKKKERLKNQSQDLDGERIKPKDRIKDPEKERGKMKSNAGIGQNQIELKTEESGNDLSPGTFNVPTSLLAKKGGVDFSAVNPNAKKRKELQANGRLHDELRPAKLPKPISGSSLQSENGFRSETAQIGIQSDKRKLGRPVDTITSLVANKERKLNGEIEHQLMANISQPSVSVGGNRASPSSHRKEHNLNGKVQHSLPESKPKTFGVLDSSAHSPSAYNEEHKANGVPDHNRPPVNNLNSTASDTIPTSTSGSERGRLLPANNDKSSTSDTVCPRRSSSAERSKPHPAGNNLKKSSDSVVAGSRNAESSRFSHATNLKSSALDTMGAGKSSMERSRPPHPDSQFLSQILSVPKMAELFESDDQEWLFSSKCVQMNRSFELEIDRTPQVWADVFHIEVVDTHALPYVIPY